MQLSRSGFNRPIATLSSGSGSSEASLPVFEAICPGRRVAAQNPPGSKRHPILGPVVGAWTAYAADDEVRFAGSSGGTLTALAAWLLDDQAVECVVGAGQGPADASRTDVHVAMNQRQVRAMAGSRYAPVSVAGEALAYVPTSVVVAKPCEVSTIRARTDGLGGPGAAPLLLSFFCAGVPSQTATDGLIRTGLGPDAFPLRSLRYRGNGWPGRFEATGSDGARFVMSYDESWGAHLGPTMQSRCKICVDGIGESADIVAGDLWYANSRGYPLFSDEPGRSVLIARTERGRAAVLGAVKTGVLVLTAVDLEEVVGVQPLQDMRRRTLLGRLVGMRVAGRPVPTYVGFGLYSLAWRNPLRSARAAVGSYLRERRRLAGEAGGEGGDVDGRS